MKELTHKIFLNNPVELLSMIDTYVTISTKYSTTVSGFVESIDPVTESVIINEWGPDGNKIKVLMGHTITKIIKEDPPENVKLFKPLKAQLESSSESVELRKLSVMNWLKSNMLPVEDVSGVLQIHNKQLCIMAPYTPDSCISSNSVILDRIQYLLRSMPDIPQS